MTNEEINEKIKAAREIGIPIFLTAVELKWLSDRLLALAEPYQKLAAGQLTLTEKLDLIHAVSIGIKCVYSLES